MDPKPRTRRAALKKIGSGSAALLAGVSGVSSAGAAKNESPDFDSYNLAEIRDFVEEYVVEKRVEKSGSEPDEVRFNQSVEGLDGLSDRQITALVDSIIPKITRSVDLNPRNTASGSVASSENNSVTVSVPKNDNPMDTWDWEIPDHVTETTQLEAAAASSGSSVNSSQVTGPGANARGRLDTFSNLQEQVAASIDYTAWRWKCVIKWRHTSSRITNSNSYDNVLYTNYAITHKGTSRTVTDMRKSTYAVLFDAKFRNNNAKICIPRTGICYDTSQTFEPSQKLKGNIYGNGTVVFNRKDTLLG